MNAVLAARTFEPRSCNSGFPPPGYFVCRTARISSTLLGQDDGPIRCPRVLRVGLDFGRRDPLACVQRLLQKCGYASEAEARAAIPLPQARLVCRPDRDGRATPVGRLPAAEALREALILGLATPWLYDPARPVLWTRASLTRRLELFDTGEFYA